MLTLEESIVRFGGMLGTYDEGQCSPETITKFGKQLDDALYRMFGYKTDMAQYYLNKYGWDVDEPDDWSDNDWNKKEGPEEA